MKFLASFLTIVMGLTAVNAAATPDLDKRCLANGSRCTSNGALGSCCSGYCLQLKGVSLLSYHFGVASLLFTMLTIFF